MRYILKEKKQNRFNGIHFIMLIKNNTNKKKENIMSIFLILHAVT